MVNGVLSNPPSGSCPVRSYNGLGRPTDLPNDRTQAGSIGVVHGRHSGMVTLEKRAIRRQLGAHGLIVVVHLDKFVTKVEIHVCAPARKQGKVKTDLNAG